MTFRVKTFNEIKGGNPVPNGRLILDIAINDKYLFVGTVLGLFVSSGIGKTFPITWTTQHGLGANET